MTESLADRVSAVLFGSSTIVLEIMSWKQSVHGVNKSGISDLPIGEHRIDLDCVLPSSLLAPEWMVGDNPTERLTGLRFKIHLRGAQKVFAGINTETASEDSKNITGLLLYHPPIPPESLAGLSTDIIEESKTGSITGWGLFDDDTLWKISHLLTTRSVGHMELWVTFRATRAPTAGTMTYETREFRPMTYRWAGKDALALWDVAVVTRSPEKTEPDPDFDATPENEIVAAIRAAKESFTRTVLKVGCARPSYSARS
jgi:hypothetical protein